MPPAPPPVATDADVSGAGSPVSAARSASAGSAAPSRSPRGLLSTRGVVLAAGGASAAAAAAMLGEPDLLRLGLFVALLPLLSLGWTMLVTERDLRGLRVSRAAEPTEVATGTPVTIRLALSRDGRSARRPLASGTLLAEDLLPAGVSRLTSPPRLLLPGGQARGEVAYTIVPLRRGTLELGPTRARPASPLGLCDRRVDLLPTTTITVTPRVVPLPAATSWREPRAVGEHRPRRPGSAPTEDASIRPYRRGDDLRLVHWRSSARRGELQVREGVDLRTPRSLVVLDTTSRGRATDAFEVAVDLAATVGSHLLGLDHDVDISTLDDAAPRRCRTRGDLLHRLAETEAQAPERAGAPAVPALGRGDIVVLCTHVGSRLGRPDGDERGRGAEDLIDHLPLVAGRNPALALLAIPDSAADDEAAERMTAALNARGWVVRTVPSATALPATWAEDTRRSTAVSGAGR